MAGLYEKEAKEAVSSCVRSSKAGVGDFDVPGVDEGDGEGVLAGPKFDDSTAARLFFFPMKSILFTGAYCTSFTPLGITQYAFFVWHPRFNGP